MGGEFMRGAAASAKRRDEAPAAAANAKRPKEEPCALLTWLSPDLLAAILLHCEYAAATAARCSCRTLRDVLHRHRIAWRAANAGSYRNALELCRLSRFFGGLESLELEVESAYTDEAGPSAAVGPPDLASVSSLELVERTPRRQSRARAIGRSLRGQPAAPDGEDSDQMPSSCACSSSRSSSRKGSSSERSHLRSRPSQSLDLEEATASARAFFTRLDEAELSEECEGQNIEGHSDRACFSSA